MLGFLKGLGKFAGGLIGLGGGGIDYDKLASALGAGGAAISGMGKDAANNRGAQFEGQMGLAQLLMQRDLARLGLERDSANDYFDQSVTREREGRAGQSDAWRKLLSSQRVMQPGSRPQLSPYLVAPRQATQLERQGAGAMSQELMSRLAGGNSLPEVSRRDVSMQFDPMTMIDPKLLQAGGMERTAGWLAPILSFLGRPKADDKPVMQTRA